MVSSALELAKITSEDPFAGLPDPSELGRSTGDLQLYSDSVAQLPCQYEDRVGETGRSGRAGCRSADRQL